MHCMSMINSLRDKCRFFYEELVCIVLLRISHAGILYVKFYICGILLPAPEAVVRVYCCKDC